MLTVGRSIARWGRRVLGAVAVLAVVAVAVLAIKLAHGPIAIDRFRPEIEGALQPLDGSFRVVLGRAEIAWEGWRDGLRVRATQLRFERPDSTLLATVPSVSMRVGVGALMRGEVALKELKLEKPKLRLVRSADGRIELGLKQEPQSAAPMLPGLLRALARDRNQSGTGSMGELEQVSIEDGELVVDDANLGHEWTAMHVNGALKRDADGISASIGFELNVDGRTVHLASRAIHHRASGTIRVGILFKDLSPKLFASAKGTLRALAWFDTPFGGAIEFDARDTGQIEGARFDLRGTRGSLTIPGYYDTPLEIVDFLLTGGLSANGRRLEITKFEIRTAGPELVTSGVFVGDEREWHYAGTFSLSGVPATEIGKYWPAGLKPSARSWVTTNITAGNVDELDLRVAIRKRQHETEPLLLELVQGAFRYDGLTVRFMEQLPPATGIRGTATFDDKDLKFAIEGGELENVKLTGGKVEILGFEKPAEDFIVVAPIEGRLPDILRVLDRKPLGFASALGVNPVAVDADVKATLDVKFLLTREVKLDNVDIRADADLVRFGWKKGLFGLDIAEGRFKLAVDKKGMSLAGVGRLGGEPAALKWSEVFGAVQGPRRALDLKTRFKVETLAAAGFDMRQHMTGSFGAELKITGTDDGRTQIDGAFDLGDAAFTTPGLPITKPQGMPATGRSVVVLQNQRVVAVPRFSIESAALQSSGSATFHPDGATVRTMELERLVAGRTNLRAVVQGDKSGGKSLKIEGGTLDITPLLAARSESGDVPLPPLRATAKLSRLYVAADRFVTDFVGNGIYDGTRWRSIVMDAKANGKPLALRLVESGNGRGLQITTADAGAALRALNITDSVVGGTLLIRANADDRKPDSGFVGSVELRNYRIIRAPVMARLLAMASFEGLGNLLASDAGVEFGTLVMPFRFRQGTLDVKDGHAEGSQIGLTVSGRVDTRKDLAALNGTIVPLYMLNSMVGKIPLLGQVIVKEKGGGLFAARFTVEGDLKNPSFTVNPLSILTPGPFRRLFDRPSADASKDFDLPAFGPQPGAPPSGTSPAVPGHMIPPTERVLER